MPGEPYVMDCKFWLDLRLRQRLLAANETNNCQAQNGLKPATLFH
jgi:hypothetical protein